ncbi:MAG: hypothetical protein Wins2KO_07360 [Winogradskyella sp.]
MNTSVRNAIIITILVIVIPLLIFRSCVIYNPNPSDCTIVSTKITAIKEGGSYDIVFKDSENESYYINRGIEQGLNLDSLKTNVLNKTVTLHIANLLFGPTKHISQMRVDDQIIFTEFD